MDKDAIALDMEFRFAPEDREKYGDGWHTYSELAIISLRGHELMKLESTFGVPMPSLMQAFRLDHTYANMACCWIALGRPGEFKDFNPLMLQVEWRAKEAEEAPGKSPGPDSEPGESDTVPADSGPFSTTPDQGSTS